MTSGLKQVWSLNIIERHRVEALTVMPRDAGNRWLCEWSSNDVIAAVDRERQRLCDAGQLQEGQR